MATLNRLLAATDLSDPARHAVDRAALIAKETGASLDLVHVASLAPLEELRRFAANIPAELEQRILDAAREELRELAAALLQHHSVSAGVRVVSGPLRAQLAAQADETSADLIVLGAHGASFMRHLLLGSTAERMISRASRSMLVVKQTAHERYRNVLVPVDFSPSSVPALRHARAVAPSAEIVLLHAFEVPFEGKLRFAGVDDDTVHHYRLAAKQDALQKLRALCDEAELPRHAARLMVLHGDPSRRIIEQEQEQDCDLIAIGKHGESMLEDLLLGSVTRRVLSESQCDVLVSV
ncbi:MAG: universal stress protein [Betaproteobacteria bacterium]|nr:universal stress protein [Betaproteobacteria bacterium]